MSRAAVAALEQGIATAAAELVHTLLTMEVDRRRANPSKRDVKRAKGTPLMPVEPKHPQRAGKVTKTAAARASTDARRVRFRAILARTAAARAELDALIAGAEPMPEIDDLPVAITHEKPKAVKPITADPDDDAISDEDGGTLVAA